MRRVLCGTENNFKRLSSNSSCRSALLHFENDKANGGLSSLWTAAILIFELTNTQSIEGNILWSQTSIRAFQGTLHFQTNFLMYDIWALAVSIRLINERMPCWKLPLSYLYILLFKWLFLATKSTLKIMLRNTPYMWKRGTTVLSMSRQICVRLLNFQKY